MNNTNNVNNDNNTNNDDNDTHDDVVHNDDMPIKREYKLQHNIAAYVETSTPVEFQDVHVDQATWTKYDYANAETKYGRPAKVPVRMLALYQRLRIHIVNTNNLPSSKCNIRATALATAKKGGFKVATRSLKFGDVHMIEIKRIL